MSGSSACTEAHTALLNSSNFNTWRNQHKTTLDGFAAQTSAPNPANQASLAAINADITKMYLCVESQLNANGGTPNNISRAQEQILDLNDQIAQEEANAAIARDRVSYIRHPEQNTSNYESWFPIDRPIHVSSLLILMSISLFISIFAFLVVLSFLGIELNIFIQQGLGINRSNTFYWLYSQITPLTIILLITLAGILYYFLNRS